MGFCVYFFDEFFGLLGSPEKMIRGGGVVGEVDQKGGVTRESTKQSCRDLRGWG